MLMLCATNICAFNLPASTSSPIHEGFIGVQAVTNQDTSQGHFDLGRTSKKPLEVSETLLKKQNYSIYNADKIPLKIQNIPITKFPPLIHVASKENKIASTKSSSLVDTIAQKAQQKPSDKLSLLQHNTLKDHSVLFLSHKAQNVSSLKMPGWTTIVALEMLQRPYTMMPLWTGNGLQNDSVSVTARISLSNAQAPDTQTGPSRRASSMNVPPGNMDTRQPVVSTWVQITSPSHKRTSLEMTPLRADSDFYNQQKGVTTRRLPQVSNGKKHPVPPVTLPSLRKYYFWLLPYLRYEELS